MADGNEEYSELKPTVQFTADVPDPVDGASEDPEVESKILSISAAFSADLSVGEKPNLGDWLARVAPEFQQSLLRRLESVVASFSPDARHEDFCEVGNTYQKSVLESRRENLADSESQETVDLASLTLSGSGVVDLALKQPVQQLGGYDLLGELGRGGMGVVYRARNRISGEVVALKMLPSVDGEGLHRFKREFRSMAENTHPNLIGLRHLEQQGDHWFFTMDLIEPAYSFQHFVRPSNQLHLGRLRSAMIQLCEGLHHLHKSEVLHRDLKSSNVVVDGNGRVVVLDFGLVSELGRSELTLQGQSISGTPAYMSPEGAAGGVESFASDWYSVGVMLYQALSGKLPFHGDPIQILLDKRTQDAPPLEPEGEVAEELSELCMRLLSRDPDLRPGYDEVRVACGFQVEEKGNRRFAVDGEEVELVGRESHLSKLHAAYRTVLETSSPVVSFVSGQSGKGKTSLVRHFLRELREHEDILILSGRCYDRESVPFKALDSLIDALASYLRTLEIPRSAMLLPDDTGFLASIFPVLTRVPVIADRQDSSVTALDQQQIRKRAFSALRVLLRRLTKKVQLVLFIDDLQWGDSDSAEALVDVLAADDSPELLLIGTYRIDERQESPFFSAWDRFLCIGRNTSRSPQEKKLAEVEVEVGSLSIEHCEVLVANRLGLDDTSSRKLARKLHGETDGNAFFFTELLECVDPTSQQSRRIPLAELIDNKLVQLPKCAGILLQLLAVAGHKTRSSELVLAAANPAEAGMALSKMRSLKLIRSLGKSFDDELLDTYHDKIRETVYDGMGMESRLQNHRSLLGAIESQADSTHLRAFDLSYHADRAQDREKARIYALHAAEQALKQLSPLIAVEQYEIAYRNSNNRIAGNDAFVFGEGFSNALILSGEYSRAKSILDETINQTTVPIEIARLRELEASAEFRMGNAIRSSDRAVEGLTVLGVSVPKTLPGMLTSICILFARIFAQKIFVPRRIPHNENSVRINLLFCQMIYAGGFSSGLRMVWALGNSLVIANRRLEDALTGRVLMTWGAIIAVVGLHNRSLKYSNRGLEILERFDDRLGVGESTCWHGINTYAAGDYAEAIAILSKGIEVLETVGDEWTRNLAAFHRALALYKLGRLDEAIVESHGLYERCLNTNDSRSGCAAYGLLRASGGLADANALLRRRNSSPEDILATCNLDKGLAVWHEKAGRFEEAIQSVTRACQLPIQQRLPNYHTFAGAPLALHVACSYLRSLVPRSQEYVRQSKKVRSLIRKAMCIALICPSESSYAWCEIGEGYRLVGKTRKAIRSFERSIRIAKRQSANHDLALATFRRATTLSERDPSKYTQEFATANQELARYDQLIQLGLNRIGQ
ncbi:MAG: protein kinase [Planctomycetales bacterium]|nr:protein kinase [Planctomycetales bacterium]